MSTSPQRSGVLTYTSAGRIGWIDVDRGERGYLDLDEPGQERWQLGPAYPDGRRQVLLSLEDTTTSEVVTGDVRTRNWCYDWEERRIVGSLLEAERPADYVTVGDVVPGSGQLLANALIDGEGRLRLCEPDGTDAVELTGPGEGFHYCETLDPEATRVAAHVTDPKSGQTGERPWFRPAPYAINVLSVPDGERTLVAGAAGHLYFGPAWSPDGEWLAYLDCHPEADPGHVRANLCVGRPDGSEHRVVTEGRRHWFGATYGTAEHRSGGSNLIEWTPDGDSLTYTRMLPDSRPDVAFDPDRPDHEENVYRPERARGGAQICLLDPWTGEVREVTDPVEDTWDLRPAVSPDGSTVAFVRARLREPPEVRAVGIDGDDERLLAEGIGEAGADFPAWV